MENIFLVKQPRTFLTFFFAFTINNKNIKYTFSYSVKTARFIHHTHKEYNIIEYKGEIISKFLNITKKYILLIQKFAFSR